MESVVHEVFNLERICPRAASHSRCTGRSSQRSEASRRPFVWRISGLRDSGASELIVVSHRTTEYPWSEVGNWEAWRHGPDHSRDTPIKSAIQRKRSLEAFQNPGVSWRFLCGGIDSRH